MTLLRHLARPGLHCPPLFLLSTRKGPHMPVLNRLVSRALVGLFLVALLPATVFAQFDTATVLGTVRDSTGAVIPGVTVTLRNVATGISTTGVTDAEGNYQFLSVRVGTYTVRAELQGFSTAEAKDISVVVNARQ